MNDQFFDWSVAQSHAAVVVACFALAALVLLIITAIERYR